MTRALILAAGMGTRLRPLTDDRPKCLVQLAGKSLLERQIDTLHKAGITDIRVAAGYRADQIENLGYAVSINKRFNKTNMVETLFSALDFIEQEGDLIIAYGDIVYQLNNLQALLECHDQIALMIDMKWKDIWSLRLDDPLQDAETLLIDHDGYVIELGKKPEGYDRIHGQYTGLIKIAGDSISSFVEFYRRLDRGALYDGKDFENMFMTSFIQALIDNGWLEIDSCEDLYLYESLYERGELDAYYRISDT